MKKEIKTDKEIKTEKVKTTPEERLHHAREYAERCLREEAQAVLDLIPQLDENFEKAVEMMYRCRGKIIVTGVGKSGNIGAKIAATLSSTGTPAFFINPLDAYHGDLGVMTPDDIVLAISNSGQTDELLRFVPILLHMHVPIIGMSRNPESLLAKSSAIHIKVFVDHEACPLNLAPTSSTTAALAMGDALAIALMQVRDFRPRDFAQFHPGGELGKRLLTKAEDVMRTEDLPIIPEDMNLGKAIIDVSKGLLGMGVSLDSDKEAKDFAAVFVNEGKKTLIEETRTQMTLDDLYNQIKEGNLKELPIVVKADVQGSVEAVSQSLLKLSNDEVVVKVIHSGVGAINESDVSLAAASNAIIIGFNVRPDNTAKVMADTQKVDIHLYNVIYEAIEDVERALNGMRAAVYEEKVQGHAEIRQMFKASGVGNIAGAYIRDGIFQRSSKVRVFRGEEKIYEGQLASLKRFKDDVKEVKEGFECGFVFDGWGDFQVDDTVEAYTMVEVPRT